MRKAVNYLVAAVGLAFAAAAVLAATGHPALLHVLVGGTGAYSMAMIAIPWQPALRKDQLALLSDPTSAGQPEVIPWALYDTASVATGATGPFVFFQASNVDKTLSNMEGPGQLPDPQYFILHYVAADILQIPIATALASEPNSAAANIENILKTVRATFTFNMSNKRYGPFPLTMCHSTGGTTGFGYGYGTAANGTSAAVVNNGVPGVGGFPFCGSVIIPPKIGFDITVNVSAATTIVSGPINLRIVMVGALYRRVL